MIAVTLQRHDTCYLTPHVTVSVALISSPWLLTVLFINGSLLWARLAYFRALLCFQISFSIMFNSKRGSQDNDMIHLLLLQWNSSPIFFKPTRQTARKPRDWPLITPLAKSGSNWQRGVAGGQWDKIGDAHYAFIPRHIVCCNLPIIKHCWLS